MHKLFTQFAQRYKNREGGYTRILQTRRRPNDSAQMAYIAAQLTTIRLDFARLFAHPVHLVRRYIDRNGELRTPRPPRPLDSLLPAAARTLTER